MASLLTSEKADVERIAVLIQECKKMGIEVLPPDINESFRNFTVVPGENKIRFGLFAIKNVGENVVGAIVDERKAGGHFQSMGDFASRINSKDLNKKSLESLAKAGCFDKLAERNQILANTETILQWSKETQKAKDNGQKNLFFGMKLSSTLSLASAKAASEQEKLSWEKELLGLFVTSHPLNSLKHIFEKNVFPITKIFADPSALQQPKTTNGNTDFNQNYHSYDQFSEGRGRGNVKIGGIISSIKKIITKTGKPMLFLKVEDLTSAIEVVVFPSIMERSPAVFQENKIVFVSGRVDMRDNTPKIICDTIEEIVEA